MAAMSGAQTVGPGADLAATALLEAFLTHARTLDSFLYGPGRSRWEHDVYAEDYLNGWRQCVLGPDFQAISQRVMHLMCERDNIADWDVHQRRLDTGKAVLDGFDTFVTALDTSGNAATAGWFKPAIAAAWNEYNLSAENAYMFERHT
ncbi:hypothetical protein K6U06_01630 [Acidiferrimicrobium sp. IK]|uniref:hypothetical protein n=1 Tax=Acidiferrimicrobium sp. IK TaxID=2871700 RepID=UPI0021CB08A5|nr:hypothetical protein [Acidiferrimicrobium sp. IK]MCU4183044.1 hypothetical protein [Acidiferrimicrobium sp. IK]